MARIQALKQQRFIETSDAPTTSFQVTGGRPGSLKGAGGVPKMHPMKSSGPVFKASSLLHKMRMSKAPKLKSLKGMKMPHLPGLRMPKI